MNYEKYSQYHVTLSSGDNPDGAESLCKAAEKEFPGIDAHLDGKKDGQPSGLVISVEGGNAETKKEIRVWLESQREKYC